MEATGFNQNKGQAEDRKSAVRSSLEALREASKVSPGNVFFATSWTNKGYPLYGMSGHHGFGLEEEDLVDQETLRGFLTDVLLDYNERTGKSIDASGKAALWSHKIFNGDDIRVMMYPPSNTVALDIDNVGCIQTLEKQLNLTPGKLTELLCTTPVLSRTGERSLHGHHYFKLPEGVTFERIKPLLNHRTNSEDSKSNLGDLIYARGKYQVVHGIHATGRYYQMFNADGEPAGYDVIHDAPVFPQWLLDAVDSLSGNTTLERLSAKIRHEKRKGRPASELAFASKFSIEKQLEIIERVSGVESVDFTDGIRVEHADQTSDIPGGKVIDDDGVVRIYCFSSTVYGALMPNEPTNAQQNDPVSALEVLLSNGYRIPLSILNARWLAYSLSDERDADEILEAIKAVDESVNPTLQELVKLMPEPKRVCLKSLMPLYNSSRLAELAAEADLKIDGVPATEMSAWLVRFRLVCSAHNSNGKGKELEARIRDDQKFHELSSQVVRLIQAELVRKRVLVTLSHVRDNGGVPLVFGTTKGDSALEKHLGCSLLANFATQHRGSVVSPGWSKALATANIDEQELLTDGWLHLITGEHSVALALIDGESIYEANLGGVKEPATTEASLVNLPVSWDEFYKFSPESVVHVKEGAKRVLGLVTRLLDGWHLTRYSKATDEYDFKSGCPLPGYGTNSSVALAWMHYALAGDTACPWLVIQGSGDRARTGKSMLSELVRKVMRGAVRGNLKSLSKDGAIERRNILIGKRVLLLEELSYVSKDEAEFSKSLATTGVEARFLFSNEMHVTSPMPMLSTSNKKLEFSHDSDDAIAMRQRTLVMHAHQWNYERDGQKDGRVVERISREERKALISILAQPDKFGFAQDVKDISCHLNEAKHANPAIHRITADAEASGAYKCQMTAFVEERVEYHPGGFFSVDDVLLVAKCVKEDWLDDGTTRQSKIGKKLIKCLKSRATEVGGLYDRKQHDGERKQGCHNMKLIGHQEVKYQV